MADGIEVQNQEKIRTLKGKNLQILKILEVNTIKQA